MIEIMKDATQFRLFGYKRQYHYYSMSYYYNFMPRSIKIEKNIKFDTLVLDIEPSTTFLAPIDRQALFKTF